MVRVQEDQNQEKDNLVKRSQIMDYLLKKNGKIFLKKKVLELKKKIQNIIII